MNSEKHHVNGVENVKAQKPRQKIFTMPRVFDANKNVEKPWHVEFTFRDPITNRMKRFRYKEGINTHKTLEARSRAAQSLKRKYTRRLKKGWTPFTDQAVVYEDNLEYKATQEVYGRLKTSNKPLLKHMSDYLDMFKPPNFEEKTYKGYQSKLRELGRWLNKKNKADLHPALFSKEDATAFLTSIKVKKGERQGRPIQGVTYNKYVMVVKSFFEYLIEQKIINENPFVKIKQRKEDHNLPQFYNEKLTSAVVQHCEENEPRMLWAIKFIYYTAIRPHELRVLQIKHIDFWNNTINVRSGVAAKHTVRQVVIPEVFSNELLAAEFNKLPRDYYLFSNKGEAGVKPVGQNYFNRNWARIREDLGIPSEYKLYYFKHTAAAVAVQDNFNVVDIMKQFGHKNLSTTQVYIDSLRRSEESEYRHGMRKLGGQRKTKNSNLQ